MCHNSEYDPRAGAQVVFGPAPRRLAALPLTLADGSLSCRRQLHRKGRWRAARMMDGAGCARVTRGRIRRWADDGTNDNELQKSRIQTDE